MATHRIDLSFEYESRERAEVVERSVAMEVGEIDDARSSTELDRAGSVVRVEIDAADHVALRAAVNTWCSLLDVAERVEAVASGRSSS